MTAHQLNAVATMPCRDLYCRRGDEEEVDPRFSPLNPQLARQRREETELVLKRAENRSPNRNLRPNPNPNQFPGA